MQPAELSLSSLLSVYNELTPEKPLKAFKDKPTALARVVAKLAATGKSLLAAEAPAEGGAKYVIVAPMDSVQPSRDTPGLRRMQENLGAEGAEALRQTVVQEQETALADAAARNVAGAPMAAEKQGRFTGKLKEPKPPKADKARDRAAPANASETPAPAVRKGRTAAIGDDAKITVLVATNPKRGDCLRRFALYSEVKTVGEYIAKVGDRRVGMADVRWDRDKGWIGVE